MIAAAEWTYRRLLRLRPAIWDHAGVEAATRTFRELCQQQRRAGVMALLVLIAGECWDVARIAIIGVRAADASLARAERGDPGPMRRRRTSIGLGGAAVDVRHAMRALLARRSNSVLNVTLLALGLATSASVFGIVDAILIHPAPFRDPASLAQIWSAQPESHVATPSMPRDVAVRWLDRHDLVSSGGLASNFSAVVTSGGTPALWPAARLSPGLLDMLGARPLMGRTFLPEEGRAGTDHVVIVSADVWRARLGGAADALGRLLRINDEDYTVVGVMPDAFRFPSERQQLWVPINLRNPSPQQRNALGLLTVRLRPGLARAEFSQRVSADGSAMAAQALRPWRYGATAQFLDQSWLDVHTQQSIWVLFGATVLLLLTVCANVSNLGMSQVFARARDAAVRSALGASRGRLVRQALVEQLLLGGAAMLIAFPLTVEALRLARLWLPQQFTISGTHVVGLDLRVAAFIALAGWSAPLIAGLVPALAGSRASVLDTLKREGRATTGTRGARLFRHALVAAEVASSVVLLVASVLLVKSFVRLQHADHGFDTHGLVVASIGFPSTRYPTPLSRDLFVDDAIGRLRELPGVTGVTASDGVPPDNGGIAFGALRFDGESTLQKNVLVSTYTVKPGFFEMLRLPVRAGRTFGDLDGGDVAIVSEAFARRYFPGTSAIDHRFRWEDSPDTFRIVGVVANAEEDPTAPFDQVFLPMRRHTPSPPAGLGIVAEYRTIAVRTADVRAGIQAVQERLQAMDGSLLVPRVSAADDRFAVGYARQRFLLTLMSIFSGVGLLLAVVGIYSVLSCLVSQRLREMGLRLTLGAQPVQVARLVIGQSARMSATGLLVGGACAVMASRAIGTLLFDVDVHDISSYLLVIVVIGAASVCAAWAPARRAMRVDPLVLLKED